MDTRNKLLEKAKTSNCTTTLHNLADCSYSIVRRAVARNRNTLSNTLNILANDPVLNVSFMAVQHPQCNLQREFCDVSNPCIACDKDERTRVCSNCESLEKYYIKRG